MAVHVQSVAQQRAIHGTLTTQAGTVIPHASVTIRNLTGRVIAFKASDHAGHFAISLPSTVSGDSLRLQVNHLGYAKVDVPLVMERERYDLVLNEQAIDLSEVDVKSRPRIRSHGDTLTYDVGSFAEAEDRSIGDVLRRMPGMEVSESGQIAYNGKNISHFYIDGDDLLDDKYSVGTKTIPHAMVQKLEVLQNHQPLKVLQNKALSDRVAINLVIKDEAKLKMTGQAKVGAGIPRLYDGELNSILFNKKYKMLNVAKGNNVGNDLARDFTDFGFSDRLSSAGNTRPQALLGLSTVGTPALPKQRYYFNNSASVNANNLVNLKHGLQLKMNVNGLLDRNKLEYLTTNELYLASDTIRYTEQQDIRNAPFLTDLILTATANEAAYYFSNVLRLAYSGETGLSLLQRNKLDMHQQLRNRIRDFSNALAYTPLLPSGHLLSISWSINHYNQPQTLSITPGINEDVFNAGNPFQQIRQFGQTPTWFNRASIAYRLTNGMIAQHYRLGMLHELQHLGSALHLTQTDGTETPYAGSPGNDLRWYRVQVFADASYEYKHGPWQTTLTLPLTAQRIGYHDDAFALNQSNRRLLFNPSIGVKRMVNLQDYIQLNYNYNNTLGNINGVYRGAILANYRTIRANDATLQIRDNHVVGLDYHFQRAINMLFMHAGLTYSRSAANTIASSIITDNIARTILLPFDNDVSSFTANGGISKFIFALGATASLKASWNASRFNQLLNGEALPFSNRNFTLNPGIEARLFSAISISYSGSGNWTASRLVRREANVHLDNRQIRQFDQTVGLTYSLFKNTFLRVNGRHQHISQPDAADVGYFFADANVRHRLVDWRMDIEFDLTNLANLTAYETYSLSANQAGYSHFRLRGRIALMKLTFNL